LFSVGARTFCSVRTDALATLNAILRNASSEGTRIPMVSPPIHFFRFGHFCGVRRASGRASFVSGNVSDSLSDGIEKYLLPRYLDARDRAQYSSSGGGASRIFHPASLPMSIEIFRRWLRAVSKFLNSGKLRSFLIVKRREEKKEERKREREREEQSTA